MKAPVIITFNFAYETEIPEEIYYMLLEEEIAHAAYKAFRDTAVITSKRLIIKDR